jgi:polyhydroxyalkanoate synthesis regulator phasin
MSPEGITRKDLTNSLADSEGRLLTHMREMEDRLVDHLVAYVDERALRTESRVQALDEKVQALDEKVQALDGKIEKVETTLLTEFHKWASPVEVKLRTHRSWFTEIDSEIERIKERLAKLESEGGKAS